MNKPLVKTLVIMRILVLSLVFLLAFSVAALFVDKTSALPGQSSPIEVMSFDGTYAWEDSLTPQSSNTDYITYTNFRNTVCLNATSISACETGLAGRTIRFDTAEALYRFSIDVSYERNYPSLNITAKNQDKIEYLMSLDYVLGNNIDYSVLGAKTFIPIGYSFLDGAMALHENNFSGTFDGQGFVISNLYVAGYDYLVHEELVQEQLVDIALSSFYTMFTTNEGVLKNFGLINPTLELLNLHIGITKVSNIVGLNKGIVDHVFVYDNRTDVLEAGIRYKVGSSSGDFEAAGIIHTNDTTGSFSNSYYVSKVVVNAAYINKFDSQPVLFANNTGGTTANLVYDSSVYLLQVPVGTRTFAVSTPNALATGETTATLKSSSSILNQVTNHWYFYPNDIYPLAQGLEYDDIDDTYLISDAIDLAFFSRLIGFVSINEGLSYAYSAYVLTNSIDMGTISPSAYRTPSVTFYGSLSGYSYGDLGITWTGLGDNYYIYNLTISTGTLRGSLYYAGLFSLLGSGSMVSDLNINDSLISLTNTQTYYSSIFHIGMLAGRMTGGTIEDVLIDVNIDLGTTAIGETHVGGVVGQASGLIQRVATTGTIDANSHVINPSYSLRPYYYIGGIIGSADGATLSVNNAVNHADIYGFGTASTFSLASGVTTIDVKIGGVVGYIYNTASAIHKFVDVANMGDIYLDNITNITTPVVLPSRQRVGGVFGELSGIAPVLEVSGNYQFANLYNSGTIHGAFQTDTAVIRAAGIGISNTTTAVEYALLFNHGNFDYITTGGTYLTQLFQYTGTIFDISSYPVTLSRVYNYSDYTYASSYYAAISPLYRSLNNNATLIRFSANFGDVYYWSNSGVTTISLATTLYLTGITASQNVSMQNVVNAGDITLVNVNVGTNPLYIAGLTNFLASGKKIENSINEGNIIFASITGTGNLYVAGIVNTNLSGDLQDPGQSPTQPIATIGIINTINYGNITTSYSATYYGVNSTNNTFVGGIVTLNAGSIQDSANLGNVSAYNSSTSGTFSIQTNKFYAGMFLSYTAGVTAGGVVSAVISGNSRIYDTGNIGDILAIAQNYARSGGVLGGALYEEAVAGGITAGMGLNNLIENSVLSNGLNYGHIASFTSVIGTYSSNSVVTKFNLYYDSGETALQGAGVYPNNTIAATADRPAVYASAGGVIGYGISVMKNMLNHGSVASTDVAGGIIGATYIRGGGQPTFNIVNISTAINYGIVKSVSTSSFSAINKVTLSYDNYQTYLMADLNTFIFPSGYTPELPGAKRGFGGIFGRLQIGEQGIMTSAGGQFNFIVNANPNIDLIGRLDQAQNFSESARYFRFNDAIYYSAKWNDTTQVVFTGFYYSRAYVIAKQGNAPYVYTVNSNAISRQVGIVNTSMPAMSGLSKYNSTSNLAIGAYQYFYLQRVTVPWITENPDDGNITDRVNQYMYDPDFPMRSNPSLTEFINYMNVNLLPPRFQATGSNPKPYGMYVLSTTAGTSFGVILPKNVNLDHMRTINEDYTPPISLYIDYNNPSALYTNAVSEDVQTKYDNLRQTIFTDKSVLIPSGATTLVLTEDDGSETILDNAVIDYVNKRIDYTISMEAYLAGEVPASYLVTQASTSQSALVAIRAYDYYGYTPSQAELEAFRALLYPETSDMISTDYPALLTVTLPAKTITGNVTLSLGYFTVYSEAFVKDNLFANSNYFTDYQVYITFTPGIGYSAGTTGLTNVAFNGGGLIDASSMPTDVRSLGDAGSAGSIRFVFTDTNNVFTSGYDFKNYFVLKYYDGSTVPSNYYTVTSVPTVIDTGTGTYQITFTFLGNLRMGDYYFTYRYFPTSTLSTVRFDKSASSVKTITDFSYYSKTDSLVINGLQITSNVNLGYVLDIDTNSNNFSATPHSLPGYLSNYTYDISYMTPGSLTLSPFASITSARLVSVTYVNGYKDYLLEYIVAAEDATTNTYNHHIYERTIDFASVLKNGNEKDPNDVYAAREDDLTSFTVDLGLDQTLDLYNLIVGSQSYLTVNVSATSLDTLTTYLPEEIVGITYGSNDYLMIFMDYDTIPGIYTFSFTYYRDGTANYVTLSTALIIRKLEGIDAYLSDIRFSKLATETSYPDMYTAEYVSPYHGDTNTDYLPVVYFGGIDYDGADLAFYEYFKVDGKVSNIPLVEYVPYMLDYMPYGASISRYAYDKDTLSWYWTTEVKVGGDQSALQANFTELYDGTEPVGDEEVMVLYRVTSEDGAHHAYYYITVSDVEFNATFIFNIYYCSGDPEVCTLASESGTFNNKMVIITVKNFLTDGVNTVINVDDPWQYPTFTELVTDPEIAPSGLISKMTQFIFTNSDNYKYSFGRNRSGFFSFNVELPLDQYLNNLYTYEIKYDVYTLYGVNEYMELKEQITLDQEFEGKYYYIVFSTKNRTRRFNVYVRDIDPVSTAKPWGLFDFFRSWDN